MDLGDGSGQVPSQAEVEGERRGNAPIILDEGPYDVPAAAGDGAVVCLVVDGPSDKSHQQVRLGIAGGGTLSGEVS
jgi:hypothetical protein